MDAPARTASAEEWCRLEQEFGGRENPAFLQRYLRFCEVNGTDSANPLSVRLAYSQASAHGMAASTLAVEFAVVFKRYISRADTYSTRRLMLAAQASGPVRHPKILPVPDLVQQVQEMPDHPVALRSLLWCMLVTGARASDLYRLTQEQVEMLPEAVRVEWRVTKTTRTRAGRHRAEYLFRRGVIPPADVLKFLAEGQPHEKPFAVGTRNRIANTMNAFLKKVGLGVTTYAVLCTVYLVQEQQATHYHCEESFADSGIRSWVASRF